MKLSEYPHPSRRKAVLAGNGAVATSQPLAAQAGLAVLRAGGNAVDAAVAAATALTVVEPTSNGIGGDLFALVWHDGRLHGLNASGRAPAAWSAAGMRERGHAAMPDSGWDSVTVPGAPSGWGSLMERFGTRSLGEVMADAIRYAAEGYPVSPTVAGLWAAAAARFLPVRWPEQRAWSETFAPGGAAPRAGERWRSPGHAATLALIAERGPAVFYEGELAERTVAFSRETGGWLTPDDLAAHRDEWVEPIAARYRGYEVWEVPPNGQGIAALQALALLEGFDLGARPQVDAESWHLQIEAMKLAFADAYRYVADPALVEVPARALLAPAYLGARRALIGLRAQDPGPGDLRAAGTVYLCTADRDGTMVSLIQSNYQGFGSGVVVPGTGIALHNRGLGFSLEPGHPNAVAPGKRPFHTIIPGFLTREGAPLGPFGVMGAPMQPQGHVQVVVGTVDHRLNPQAALDAPRWRVLGGLDAVVEAETPQAVYRGLIARGHRLVEPSEAYPFGRGQIIWRLDEGVYVAGSESRADGCVAAY